jgi:CRISPR-associated protein Cas2
VRHRYLVTYDVTDDKRLKKVYKRMCGFGDPVQYSVFLCDLSAKERVLLIGEITGLIKHDEDQVLIVNLGPAEGRGGKVVETLGRSLPVVQQGAVVV